MSESKRPILVQNDDSVLDPKIMGYKGVCSKFEYVLSELWLIRELSVASKISDIHCRKDADTY